MKNARRSLATSPPRPPIPRELLEALALNVLLTSAEWRVMAVVLAAPSPLTARQIASRLRLA